MVMKTLYRRVSDRVPLGIECALPWIPTPPSLGRPEGTSLARKLSLAVVALFVLLGGRSARGIGNLGDAAGRRNAHDTHHLLPVRRGPRRRTAALPRVRQRDRLMG